MTIGDGDAQRRLAQALAGRAIGMTSRGGVTSAAQWLLTAGHGMPPSALAEAVGEAVYDGLRRVAAAGWGERDIAEVTRRRLGDPAVSLLEQLARGRAPDPRRIGDLQRALAVAAMLSALPPLPDLGHAVGSAASEALATNGSRGRHEKLLARVRALLAKAESTAFPEEADALTAKAQELISRHSLDDLLAEGRDPQVAGVAGVTARRIWLDGSYVRAKAMLVGAVARANRSTAVVSVRLGCVTVVGSPRDLDAVELLTASLLTQASVAMGRAGREPSGSRPAARSASFRRAFLAAFADRIGERLQQADRDVVGSSGAELVPVLRRHEAQVESAVSRLFPVLQRSRTTVSNLDGWAAGRAAADQATLHVRRQVG